MHRTDEILQTIVLLTADGGRGCVTAWRVQRVLLVMVGGGRGRGCRRWVAIGGRRIERAVRRRWHHRWWLTVRRRMVEQVPGQMAVVGGKRGGRGR